jgi:3-oxo-5-alpha-steroid 4-dehydrogenase
VVIFLLGSALQFHSHYVLARLAAKSGLGSKSPRRRKSSGGNGAEEKPTKSPRYRIPRGGGFDYVSCPHYLGEIVIYLGLAVLAGGLVLGPWLALAWVVRFLTFLFINYFSFVVFEHHYKLILFILSSIYSFLYLLYRLLI